MGDAFSADTFDINTEIAFIDPQREKDKLFPFWCIYHFRSGLQPARKKHFVH
jgi:hypothetical protein